LATTAFLGAELAPSLPDDLTSDFDTGLTAAFAAGLAEDGGAVADCANARPGATRMRAETRKVFMGISCVERFRPIQE
jgi:hypothetical protein